MAITTLFLTGFEHGFVGTGADAGSGLISSVVGSGWSASASSPRNGNYCAHLVAPANTTNGLRLFTTGATRYTLRVAVKVTSRPGSGASSVFYATENVTAAVYTVTVSSAGVLSAQVSVGAVQTGPTIDTTGWHLLEVQVDTAARTLDWKVDGVAQAQAFHTSGGNGLASIAIGTLSSAQPAFTADFDDLIFGSCTDPADWYGDGKVLAQLPGSDGTHVNEGSFGVGDSGSNYSPGATTVYQMVDDAPGTNGWTATHSTTDAIGLRTIDSAARMTIRPTPTTETGKANAVRGLLSYSSATATANLAACDVRNSEGVSTPIWGTTGGTGANYGVATNNFKGAIVTPPGAGWTATEVNALAMVFGGCTSGDSTPRPTAQAMMLEVDWPVIAVPSQTIALTNAGEAPFNWTATANQPWLSVTPSAGSTTAETDTLTASVNPQGLARGTYNGTVTITSAEATNSPVTVPVSFVITAPSTTLPRTASDSWTVSDSVTRGPSSGPSYRADVLADNPISYWRLGNAVTAHDEMGTSPDTTQFGGWADVGLLTNDPDGSILFDGADDFNEFGGAAVIAAHSVSNGTLEIWMKSIESGVGGSFRALLVKSEAYGIFCLDNELATYDWGGGATRLTGRFLNDNVRHHVVLTFQSGVAGGSQFYVDGVAVGAPFSITVSQQGQPLTISKNSGGQFFRGNLDEAAIYGTVLSPARIAARYQTGIGAGGGPAAPRFTRTAVDTVAFSDAATGARPPAAFPRTAADAWVMSDAAAGFKVTARPVADSWALTDTVTRQRGAALPAIPMTGMAGWFKADALARTDGQAVGTWTDSSGNGNDATSAPGPTYRTNQINGQPAISFDGVDDSIGLPAISAAAPDRTVFAVVSVTNFSAYRAILGASAGSGLEWRINLTTAGRQAVLRQAAANIAQSTVSLVAGVPAMIGFYFTSAGGMFRLNQADSGAIGATGTFAAGTTAAIGAQGVGGGERYAGLIAELVVYDRVLTATERGEVETYLYAKYWGTPSNPMFTRAVNDSWALSDEATSSQQASLTRPVTDAWSLSDAALRAAAARVRAAVDATACSDAVTRVSVRARAASDALVVSDTAARAAAARTRPAVDAVATADAAARAAATRARAVIDATVLSDTAVRAVAARVRAASDSWALSDTVTRGPLPPTRTAGDSWATSDSAAGVKVATRAAVDSWGAADTVTRGPATGAGPFSPDQITGLAIWLDASALGLSNGAAVTSWPNPGTGPDGSIVGTPAPTFATNALNGKPVVQFRTNEGRLRMTGTGVARDFTLVYVGRVFAGANGRLVTGSYPAGGNFLVGYHGGNQDTAYDGAWFTPNLNVAVDGSVKLYSADAKASSAELTRLFIDGVYRSTGVGADAWGNTFHISGMDAAGTQETVTGDAAEVVVYDHKLSDVERQKVEDYLRFKWTGVGTPPTGSAAAPMFTRTASDVVALGDSASTRVPVPRAAADTLATADVAVRAALARVRTATDSWTSADTAARVSLRARTALDTVATGDAALRATVRTRVTGDAWGTGDSAARTIKRLAPATDAWSASDSAARVRVVVRAVVDSWTSTDAVTRGPAPGAAAYRDVVLADNPISYWRLNGLTVHDEMGVAPDTAATGGTSVPGLLTGDADTALAFDGVDDKVVFPNVPAHTGVSVGSLEIWMTTTDAGPSHRALLVKGSAYGLFLFDNQLVTYDWGGGGGNQGAGVFLNDGVRHHVVMTFQSGVVGGVQFYVDGVAVGPAVTLTAQSYDTGFSIAFNWADTQDFKGVLDDAAFYGAMLSPARIAAHYQAGIGAGGGAAVPMFTRAASDVVAMSDSASTKVPLPRAAVDALAVGDVVVRTSTRQRAVGDVLVTSDTVARARVSARPVVDSWSISDTATRARVSPRAATDATALSDAAQRVVSRPRTATDSWSATDSVARVRTVVRVGLDSWAVGDAVTRGPGVGAPFTPAALTGLAGWYDASQLALADGAAVLPWPDLSGQGRSLVGGYAATFKANVLNGLPVLRFDGVDDNLVAAPPTANYQHFFVVAKYNHDYFASYDGLIGGIDWLVLTGNDQNAFWYPYEQANTTYHKDGVLATGNWPGPMGAFAVMSVSRVTPWPIQLQVGCDRNIGGRTWDGDVAEVIAFDRVLTPAERVQVEQYLAYKWLGTGAPSAGAAPMFTRTAQDWLVAADTADLTYQGMRAAAADTVALSDLAARALLARTRTAVDSWACADATSRVAARARAAADVVARSDAANPVVGRVRPVADSWAVVDTATRATVRARTAVDPVTFTDAAVAVAVTGKISAAVDAVAVSDAAVRAVVARQRTAVDVVASGDSVPRVVGRTRVVADSFAVGDSALGVKVVVRVTADAVALADTATRAIAARLRIAADTLVTGDAATRQTVRARTASDAATFSDVAAGVRLLPRFAADSFSVTGSATRVVLLVHPAADTVAMADTALRSVVAFGGRGAFDLGYASDTATALVSYAREAFDSWTVSDLAFAFVSYKPVLEPVSIRLDASRTRSTVDVMTYSVDLDAPGRVVLDPSSAFTIAP